MADTSQYLVNHLVTFSLQNGEVRSVEEAVSRLSHLARTDRLWSQEMLLEVSSEAVRLRDAQNQEELEAFHVSSIHRCDAILTEKQFPSLLLLVCQSAPHKKPDVLFFNCETVGAELIRGDIILTVSDYTSKTSKHPEALRANKARMQQQPAVHPAGIPQNSGAIRVMGPLGIPNPPLPHAPNPPPPNPPPYPGTKANGTTQQADTSLQRAQREVDILNHCFDDIEFFMGKLQKSAEAYSVLSQRNKKKKSRKKEAEDDLLTLRARAPAEEEFVDIFQKFKYSFSLLARLKSCISNPTSEELLHHIFVPLDMIVRTTGGPALAASVSTPAMTSGAVSLLSENLTDEERQLWTTLGTNWTLPRSQLRGPVPPYTPVFLDGWKPEAIGPGGQPWDDPIESQHKQDVLREKQELSANQSAVPLKPSAQTSEEQDGSSLPPGADRLYRCSYDFVARNSSELSVLQGEMLEVVESSKRWWKCRNRFDQIGFVPFNILEPLSALNDTQSDKPAPQKQPKDSPSPHVTRATYTPPAPPPLNPDPSTLRPRSMPPHTQHSPSAEDMDKVMVINDELLQRLTNGKANIARPLVIPRSTDTSVPLDYHSLPSEVEEWLRGKGFSEPTVQCLGVLTGAQLFSLNKDELRAVTPDEGARVYSQIMVQKALLEDAHKATELEAVMEKQKMKVDLKMESSIL
ncbi:epidermal growth factor receptor kinase substrate 8-like protein 1 [Megalops cyprinoides]|uniref:epidermal growth factor receptor kinase substrate 8-like protein 1 n=1 Tax=Megalops cyprinoides TaxID=118141 RepID=UPI001864DE6E|nr:epidermal growth factor receptor kinase substrate 8-like protein 1 [Megalops cyprinoides]XP_036381133.1 epidermal growth factor receptor kinase substrate 8-like protein 1 [Megalops cyprinoides]XP_036381141.1 epidermal growth factor receptor kinase substrate 8-like protein 1 [Megalops cyprinoides]